MKTICIAFAALVALPASHLAFAAEMPPAVTAKSPVRIWVDQIGYRTASRKIVIVASDQPLPADLAIEVCDAKTLRPVWVLKDHAAALKPYKNGQKDGESGEYLAHLDLSDLKMPGRYFVAVVRQDRERSYAFSIGPDVYRAPGFASWKAFYYNRADHEIPEKYGGLWTHKMDHRGPNQATEARVYKWTGAPHYDPVGKEVADPAPHDVSGGWWDAGNFDKYMGNTTNCHNELLLGVQLLGDAPKDGDLAIPESGNGVPDVLDEVRCGTEWIIRMGTPDGAAFGRAYEKPACPPEADARPVMLTQQTSGATMNRAACLAYASVVWTERRLDPAFAKRCMEESLKSWNLLQAKPHPWPADPKDPKKPAYTGEWFFANYDRCRALAAACYFRATGKPEYHDVVRQAFAQWKSIKPGEDTDLYSIIQVYIHTPGADADLAARMKKMICDAADAVVKQTGEGRGYIAAPRGYWWGSNRMVGQPGLNCLLAAEFAADPASRQRYLETAEEFVHYLYGRNPLGLCYLSNMKSFGAENSVMVMFHSWVGKDNDKASEKYIGEGPGKIGPFPGMVVGGVNGGMKKYVDDLDWRKKCWEFNEPCLTYQSPCAAMMIYCGLKLK